MKENRAVQSNRMVFDEFVVTAKGRHEWLKRRNAGPSALDQEGGITISSRQLVHGNGSLRMYISKRKPYFYILCSLIDFQYLSIYFKF